MIDGDWKTPLLYAVVGIFVAVTLWRWHVSDRYRQFTMVDLITEGGQISGRKFMEFGAWVTATVAIVTLTLNDKLSVEYLATYIGVFVLGRLGGQAVHTYQSTVTRKAEIMRGRSTDIPDGELTVEEQEAKDGGERRGLTRRFEGGGGR
jgi:hypothetical protein